MEDDSVLALEQAVQRLDSRPESSDSEANGCEDVDPECETRSVVDSTWYRTTSFNVLLWGYESYDL